MRRWLAVVLLAPLLIGCTSPADEADQPARTAPMTGGTPSPDRQEPAPTNPGPSPTAPAVPPPTGATRPPAPGATPPPPDDRRGDLVKGRRTLTGAVSRDGACITLLVAGKRWSLSGAPTERLADGDKVRVTGTVATVRAACPGDHALVVTQVQPA
ncbi:DUF5818 domain-containing protein [Phytohabitans sp. LJ34]|uniref:DUF5818 domain-containing protein n=1 Tax=Phytohabitans sp. LJ34 TaxID=3452217 RepID=UPI003F8AD45C